MPKPPPGHEPEVDLVARMLRSVRGARTQEEIAARFHLSDAAWSRFEKREQVPDLSVASAVDEAFSLEGALARLVRDILFEAVRDPRARTFETFVFEPEHLGPVWVHLRAAPDRDVVPTGVTLHWGCWTREQELELDEVGVALSFAKLDRSTRSTPLRVRTTQPSRMRHGAGMPDHLADDRVLDANDGWTCDSHGFPTPGTGA